MRLRGCERNLSSFAIAIGVINSPLPQNPSLQLHGSIFCSNMAIVKFVRQSSQFAHVSLDFVFVESWHELNTSTDLHI